jgi:adenylate cyclase
MNDGQFRRHLAALLSADVVGYSRLMADDEIGTIRALTTCRDKITEVVKKNGGRLVDFVGDNMLAEFSNTLDAVQCADRIHHTLEKLNRSFPEHRYLEFRIGIHLGDVMTDGDRIYGAGVNIAARLESIAKPGGICISDMVFRQIQGKLDMEFVNMGAKELKNIPEPVMTYQLVTPKTRRMDLLERSGPTTPRETLPLPTKPSLAVLPFVNLDMDQEQDHFSDGLTIDIITALVQIPSLFLISDSTSFSIKTKPMSIPEIGRRLGVQYVLEGGVRRSGNRLRISAKLSETGKGRQIWAQRYDRQLGDIFEIQDEITSEIVTAMDIKLVSGEPARLVRKVVKNPKALEYYYRGWSAMFSSSPEYIQLSQQMFEEMIRLEPDSFLGYSVGAWAYWWGIFKDASVDKSRDLKRVQVLVSKAQALGDDTGMADLAMAHIHLLNKDHEKALAAAEQAVLNRPSCDVSFAVKASVLTYLGRPDEAIPLARFAIRLSPVYPSYYPTILGYAYYHCGKFKEAREAAEVSIEADPTNLEALILITAIHVVMGAMEQARKTARSIINIHPGFSLTAFAANHPYQDQKHLDQILTHLNQTELSARQVVLGSDHGNQL